MAEGEEVSEDELAGWHHQCNRHELGQTSGDGEGQRGLACFSPWGCTRLGDRTTATTNKALTVRDRQQRKEDDLTGDRSPLFRQGGVTVGLTTRRSMCRIREASYLRGGWFAEVLREDLVRQGLLGNP